MRNSGVNKKHNSKLDTQIPIWNSPQLHAPCNHHKQLVDCITSCQHLHTRPEQLQAGGSQQGVQVLAGCAPALTHNTPQRTHIVTGSLIACCVRQRACQ